VRIRTGETDEGDSPRAALAVATVAWGLVGYSLAFSHGGGFGLAALRGVGFAPRAGTTIPHLVFFASETTFCIITAALVSGAVVERMRFAHWSFGGGWLQAHGTLDFAGGVPLETDSGRSALAVRAGKDYGRQALLPHNAIYVLLGAGLLWFGWFGFNGGSGFGINHQGELAFTNTLLTPACTLVVWFTLDLLRGRRVTAIGMDVLQPGEEAYASGGGAILVTTEAATPRLLGH
jgi:Amt family ammonium transporter